MSGMGPWGLYFNKHPAGHANRQVSLGNTDMDSGGCPKGWTVSSVIFLLELLSHLAMACVSTKTLQNFNL